MIVFNLTRKFADSALTVGELHEPTTNFKCVTLEKEHPNYAKTQRKPFLAIPDGEYKLKLVNVEGLLFTLGLSFTGTYRKAVITGATTPDAAPAGSICIGEEYKEGQLEKAEETGKAFCQLVERLMDEGKLSPQGKVGDAHIVVTTSPTFTQECPLS